MKFIANKRFQRLVALFLTITLIGANMATLSFASTGSGADENALCGISAHTHTQSECYEEAKTDTCGMEEGSVHFHTEEAGCFVYDAVLICGQKESETHTHCDSCWEQERTTVCTTIEGVPHVHDEAACYLYGWQKVCKLTEHSHESSCYAETASESEQEENPEEDSEEETEEKPEEELTEQMPVVWQSVNDSAWQVSVTGMLPEGVEVQARAMTAEELLTMGVNLETLVFAYDITLWVNGAEYQPENPVEVVILSHDLPAESDPMDVTVQHIDVDDLTGATMVETVTSAADVSGNVTFTADGFSVYVGTLNEVEQSAYEQLMAAETLADMKVLLSDEEYLAELDALSDKEIQDVADHLEAVYAVTGEDDMEVELMELLMTRYPAAFGMPERQAVGNQFTSTGGTLGSGEYYLTKDTTLSNTLVISGSVTLDLNGCVLQGNGINEVISVGSGGRLTILDSNPGSKHDGNVRDNGLWYNEAGNTPITGGIIYNRATGKGMVVSGTCTIQGGTIAGCYSDKIGAAVTVSSSGILSMTGGKIAYNKAMSTGTQNAGGAIYGEAKNNNSGSRIDLSVVTIIGNTSVGNGGAICGYNVTMDNCIISNNKTDNNGAAVYIRTTGGNLTVQNCTIDSNYATENGGAFYGEVGTSISISNGTVISNNTAGNNGGGIYGAKVSITGTNVENIKIYNNVAEVSGGGIYVTSSTVLTEACTIDYVEIDDNYAGTSGGGLFSARHTTITNSQIINNRAMKTETGISVVNKGRGGGIWIQGSDVECTITGSNVSHNAAMYYGGGVQVCNNASLKLVSGTISYNEAILHGAGGVHVTGNATFTLDGGEISHNTAHSVGGAIHSSYSCQLHLNKGSIHNNTVYGRGGGVHVNVGGTLNLKGTDIYENKAYNGTNVYAATVNADLNTWSDLINDGSIVEGYGGGVVVDAGTCEMTAGTLTENYAETGGGGIALVMINTAAGGNFYMNQVVKFKLENGTILNNTTDGNGAGIYLMRNKLSTAELEAAGKDSTKHLEGTPQIEISGGIVSENEAKGDGGAAYQEVGTKFIIGGVAVMEENRAKKNGGAVYIAQGEAEINGGTMNKNEATEDGGALFVNGTVAMNDGAITSNEAGANGGGVYVSKYGDDAGSFIMAGGTVASNTAVVNGGGISVTGGDFRMEGGSVGGEATVGEDVDGKMVITVAAANTAANGGGVSVTDGNVTIIDGSITGNTAFGSGGGMYIAADTDNVQVNMLSGSLNYNVAGSDGGGMAVEGVADKVAIVNIGCLQDHKVKSDKTYDPFDYVDLDATYNYLTLAGTGKQHKSCPQVVSNQCADVGGGFYMNSATSTLNFYCMFEKGNVAKEGQESCWGMDVEGGTVNIGDAVYHNSNYKGGNHTSSYGYVQINSEILITGGDVNIYGDMDNPQFIKNVTVDIQSTGGSYTDHRRAETDDEIQYKVHYIENFKAPGSTDKPTGTYIAKQYVGDAATAVTIEKGMFYREGYEIAGWYALKKDGTEVYYKVGETKNLTELKEEHGMGTDESTCGTCGNHHAGTDEKLLKLYADWVIVGYQIAFDPGVETGQNVTGTMKNMSCYYNQKYNLTKNAFVRPGYWFNGWKGSNGVTYADQAEVEKLSSTNGAVITMTAQWLQCQHDPNATMGQNGYTCTLSYTAKDNTLSRECSCGGQTITATLLAEDTIYNGQAHPASVSFSKEEAVASETTTFDVMLAYAVRPLNSADNVEYDDLTDKQKPIDSGEYRAILTAVADSAKSVEVDYNIDKAPQPAPLAPEYEVEESQDSNSSTLKIKPVAKSQYNDGEENRWYRVVYYDANNLEQTSGWLKHDSGRTDGFACETTVDIKLTNYYVEAYYAETKNHLASDPARANQVFYFSGDIKIEVKYEEGITGGIKAVGNSTVELDLSLLTGYYLTDGKYHVSMKVTDDNGAPKLTPSGMNEGHWVLSEFPNTVKTVELTVSGAKKIPTVTVNVHEDQIFSAVSGAEVTISRDSAFTVRFDVGSYDSEAYNGLALSFGTSDVPAGTNVILVDKTNGANQYWYTKLTSEASSVVLTSFKKMGGSEDFTLTNGDHCFQFVVDFSQTAGGCAGENLIVTMAAEKSKIADTDTLVVPNAPDWPATKDTEKAVVTLRDTTFDLTREVSSGLTNTLKMTYTPAVGGTSKWDNRHSALVLTSSDELPPDAKLSVKIGDNSAIYDMTGSQFVVLLAEPAIKTAEITLMSDMFPDAETIYTFTAQWMVADSLAEGSPIDGDMVAELAGEQKLDFVKAAKTIPSLKIANPSGKNYHLVSLGDNVRPVVEWKNLQNYKVMAMLEKRNDTSGSYSANVGWSEQQINTATDGRLTLDLNASNQFGTGSYRIRVTAMKNDTLLLETYYYFIIK